MSIALQSGGQIGGSGFLRGIGCVPIDESAEIEERKNVDPAKTSRKQEGAVAGEGLVSYPSFSSSSSSIGKDSDAEGSEEEGEDGEVQSGYKGPLEDMLSVEESLPIRRGISNFYIGKSKSFTSLSDAMSSGACAKDLGKSENAYIRRRRSLLTSKTAWDKPHGNMLRSSGMGITKKPPAPPRATLAIAAATGGSPRLSNGVEDDRHDFRPPPIKPPAPYASPVGSPFPMRSFSLSDLAGMASRSLVNPSNV